MADTPGDVARAEAAKQAVGLAFGVAGALFLMWMQKRMMRGLLPGDPSVTLEDAARRERRWGKAAVWLWRYGPFTLARWAEQQAERARQDYEAGRL